MRKYAMITVVTIACLTAFSFALAGGREYIPVPKTPNLQTGYIEKIEHKDNQYILSIDHIDWYEGEQAAQKFRELEEDSGMDAPPDGYYIINDDSTLKDLPIADDAVVLMQIYNRTGDVNEADIVWDEQISVDKFVELLNTEDDFELKNFPYHVTVQGGEIVRIVQQYIP
ncbi:MAG: hypothetical protein ACE3L7_06475 [Candidatus Pristimantibacillus sp.]